MTALAVPVDHPPVRVASRRLVAIDALRGIAIIAVVAFHLVWDLGHFGWMTQWCTTSAGRLTGHLIAGTFLTLVGVSLALAHHGGLRARAFWTREAKLVGCALLVTAASYLVEPNQVVTFGILHDIALTSILLVPFLVGSRLLAVGAALLAGVLPQLITIHSSSDWVTWTGLSHTVAPTLDYQPLLPMLALSLLGLVAGRTLAGSPRWRHGLAAIDDPVTRLLGRIGRHTLAIYLLHQPVLWALLWGIAALR